MGARHNSMPKRNKEVNLQTHQYGSDDNEESTSLFENNNNEKEYYQTEKNNVCSTSVRERLYAKYLEA